MHSWSAPALPTLPAPGEGHRIHLHDTVTGRLQPTGGPEQPATLYVCGITPYDATHLGHATTYLSFDLLVRAWLDAGRTVHYTQNVTDVDDPLLERAEQTGQDWRELAREQTDLFRSDMTHLRVIPPEHYIGAVEAIPQVVRDATTLLEAGQAYRVTTDDHEEGQGDLYADLAADAHALDGVRLQGGELDGSPLEEVFAERGGDPERAGKRGALDPLVWRRQREGEPAWDGGDLGDGRPGWHIECAAIARAHLGDHVEVQGGGSDLIFPHHAMSTSHLRLLTGRPQPVDVHAHVGMVAYQGTKMSKSLGNLVLVSKLVAAGTDPAAIRLAVYAHHYRSDWEYTDAVLDAATERLALWRCAVDAPAGPDAAALLAQVRERLAEDLDAPGVLAAIDAWARAAVDGTAAEQTGQRDENAPAQVRRIVDALLGIEL